MKYEITISIIIPFYNTPTKYFRRCINSVLEQSYGRFEVIVVNDGSEEKYNPLLNEVSSLDNRIRVINKENEGAAVARNIGVIEAKSDYIMFLDSDDAITDYCLEEAVNAIIKYDADLVIGLAKRFDENGMDAFNGILSGDPQILIVDTDEKRSKLVSHMLGYRNSLFEFHDGYVGDAPWARVLRKSIAEKSLFSKESFWSDDTIWNLKMLNQCDKVILLGNLWYKYLIYLGSKIRRFRPECPSEFKYRTKQELDLAKELWPNCIQGIYTRIFGDIMILSRTFLFHSDNPLSERERYRYYISCIHQDAYREALKGIDFSEDKRVFHRIGKKLVWFCLYHGPHIVAYQILKFYNKIMKGKI